MATSKSKVLSAVDKVQLSGSLEFPFWVIQQDVPDTLNGKAVVRVKAPPPPAVENRASIDLVAVLNISTTSVLGPLKKAMKFVITKLGVGDNLSIVALFNNDSNTYTDAKFNMSRKGDRESAEKKVDEIVAGEHPGSKSGLEHGEKILLDARSESETRQGFIILVSDGLDNSESPSQRSMATGDPTTRCRQYPVHTMGLGKAHNPKELHSIAEESNGTYSSITEDLDSKILEAFAVCLAGLKSVVAVETCITFEKGGKITDHSRKSSSSKTAEVKIKSIDWPGSSCKKGSSDVMLGVLYAGEVKDLMVDIDLTVNEMHGYLSIEVLIATVKYKDVQRMKPQEKQPETKEKPPAEKCILNVNVCATSFGKYCKKDESNQGAPFPMVMNQRVRSKVLKFFSDQFKAELEQKVGRTGPAGKLEESWEAFKENDSLWKKAQRIGDDYLLERIDDDIDAMVSCLKRGSGLARLGCVYSWVLSYEKQRATFTGLPAAMFLTPVMKKMVEEAQTEVDATTSSAVTAGSTHLAPPETRLVEAGSTHLAPPETRLVGVLKEIVMGILKDQVEEEPSQAQTRQDKVAGGEAKHGKAPASPARR